MVLAPAFLAGSVFLLIVAGAAGIFLGAFARNQDARLTGSFERNIPRSVLQRESVQSPLLPKKLLQWYARRLRETPSGSRRVQRTQKLLVYAGFNALDAVIVFRLTQIAAAGVGVAGGILTSFVLHKPRLACAIFGAVLGYVVTEYMLRKMGATRQTVLARELPAALDLLVVSLEAGLGIGESIKVIGRETERQGRLLGAELATVSAEMSAGLSLEDALRNLDERTGVEDCASLEFRIVDHQAAVARGRKRTEKHDQNARSARDVNPSRDDDYYSRSCGDPNYSRYWRQRQIIVDAGNQARPAAKCLNLPSRLFH